MVDDTGGETGREAGCGIGARLRSARERSGLTLEQAAQRLHLTTVVVSALEAEDFASLGAPIYVKSYLGRYAELLGESPEALQQLLAASVVIPQPDLTRVPRAAAIGSRLGGPTAAAAAAGTGAVIVLSLAWWGWSRHHATALPAGTPATTSAAAGPAAPPTRAVPAVQPTAAGLGAAARPTGAVASQGAVSITLQFSAPCWVEVDDATGRRLYQAVAPAGAVHAFAGAAPLHVVLGYAPGVTLAVNGRTVPIAHYAAANHAASIEITTDGRVLRVPRTGGG